MNDVITSKTNVTPHNDGGYDIKEINSDGSVLQKSILADGRTSTISHDAPDGQHSFITFLQNSGDLRHDGLTTLSIFNKPDNSEGVAGWVKSDPEGTITDAVLRIGGQDGHYIEMPTGTDKTVEAMNRFYEAIHEHTADYYQKLGVPAPKKTSGLQNGAA